MFRVIAVDDETKVLDRFERMMVEEPRVTVAGKFTRAADAVDFARHNPVDIAFLDIEMPELNGLELAKMLSKENPTIEIVFITAYDGYALKAFQAHAVGYLLKPFAAGDIREQLDVLERKLRYKMPIPSRRLTVKCFGSFLCCADTVGEPVRWRTSKAEELFALLLHYRGGAVSREIFIDLLWPDADPEKASNYFRVTCTYLRNALTGSGFNDILLRERDHYRINTAYIDCDMMRFQDAVELLPSLETDALESASGLYTGAYLENMPYEWAFKTRVWMENAFKDMQRTLADRYNSRGEYDKARSAIERILEQDPFEESAVEMLISLFLHSGSSTSAVKLYRDYEKRLLNEMGLSPSDKLKETVSVLDV